MGTLNPTVTIVEDDGENIGFSILMQFSDARREIDLEIRKLITVFCHVFRDHKAPPTPSAYLRATCSSLELISAAKPRPSAEVLRAHFSILSNVIPRVPAAFLVNNLPLVCNSIVPALRVAYMQVSYNAAACAGIDCIAQLLTNGVSRSWSQVSATFRFLLSYVDNGTLNFKVRDHVGVRIHDTMQYFKATDPVALLVPATKHIMDLLNKYPMRQSDGEIHYKAKDVLDLVILCFGVMPAEDTTPALVYFKELLELHHTNVTTLITESLYRLCLESPLSDVHLELLLDLVCSICVSVSQHKTEYIVRSIAGLLSFGVPKIYGLNKDRCKARLPLVFDALIVVLDQIEFGEDVIDAGNALKCLIAYIDESLIRQGVERTLMNANLDDGSQSEPTLIEKLCATFPKLLSYPTVQDHVFEIVFTMFDKLGEYSSYLMKDTVKTLADMHKLPDKTFPDKEKVKLLLEMVLEKCGLDAITAIIPQEHMGLLAEINQQRGSKSVGASSHVFKATTSGNNLSQSKYTNNDFPQISDDAYKVWLNYKRKMAGKKGLSDRQWKASLERRAKRRAEDAISQGLVGAARMTKKA